MRMKVARYQYAVGYESEDEEGNPCFCPVYYVDNKREAWEAAGDDYAPIRFPIGEWELSPR